MLKTTIHRTYATCFPRNRVHESKKNLPPSSSDINLVNSLTYSEELCNRNYIVKTSKTLIT